MNKVSSNILTLVFIVKVMTINYLELFYVTGTNDSNTFTCKVVFFQFSGVRKVLKNGNKEMYDLEKKINEAVFPGLQGGPHNHQIGGEGSKLLQMLQWDLFIFNQLIFLMGIYSHDDDVLIEMFCRMTDYAVRIFIPK